MKGAVLVDNQISPVGGAPLDLRDGQGNEPVTPFGQGIGARADEGQVDLTFPQELIDLPISLALHEFQVFSRFAGHVGQKLPVMDKGLPGGDHGRHRPPEGARLAGGRCGPGHGQGLGKIHRGLVRVAAAAAGAQGQPGNATDCQQTADPYRRLFVSGASLIRHNQAFGTG